MDVDSFDDANFGFAFEIEIGENDESDMMNKSDDIVCPTNEELTHDEGTCVSSWAQSHASQDKAPTKPNKSPVKKSRAKKSRAKKSQAKKSRARRRPLTSCIIDADEFAKEISARAKINGNLPLKGNALFKKQIANRLTDSIVNKQLISFKEIAELPVLTQRPHSTISKKKKPTTQPIKTDSDSHLERELALKQIMQISKEPKKKSVEESKAQNELAPRTRKKIIPFSAIADLPMTVEPPLRTFSKKKLRVIETVGDYHLETKVALKQLSEMSNQPRKKSVKESKAQNKSAPSLHQKIIPLRRAIAEAMVYKSPLLTVNKPPQPPVVETPLLTLNKPPQPPVVEPPLLTLNKPPQPQVVEPPLLTVNKPPQPPVIEPPLLTVNKPTQPPVVEPSLLTVNKPPQPPVVESPLLTVNIPPHEPPFLAVNKPPQPPVVEPPLLTVNKPLQPPVVEHPLLTINKPPQPPVVESPLLTVNIPSHEPPFLAVNKPPQPPVVEPPLLTAKKPPQPPVVEPPFLAVNKPPQPPVAEPPLLSVNKSPQPPVVEPPLLTVNKPPQPPVVEPPLLTVNKPPQPPVVEPLLLTVNKPPQPPVVEPQLLTFLKKKLRVIETVGDYQLETKVALKQLSEMSNRPRKKSAPSLHKKIIPLKRAVADAMGNKSPLLTVNKHPQPPVVEPPLLTVNKPPQPPVVESPLLTVNIPPHQPPFLTVNKPPQPPVVEPPLLTVNKPPQPPVVEPPLLTVNKPPQPPVAEPQLSMVDEPPFPIVDQPPLLTVEEPPLISVVEPPLPMVDKPPLLPVVEPPLLPVVEAQLPIVDKPPLSMVVEPMLSMVDKPPLPYFSKKKQRIIETVGDYQLEAKVALQQLTEMSNRLKKKSVKESKAQNKCAPRLCRKPSRSDKMSKCVNSQDGSHVKQCVTQLDQNISDPQKAFKRALSNHLKALIEKQEP